MKRIVHAAFIAVAFTFVGLTHGSSETGFRTYLRGVSTVRLFVGDTSGWSQVSDALAVIEPEIVSILRSSGLRVLTEDDLKADPSAPRLEVSVQVAKTRGSLRALSLSGAPDSELEATDSAYVFSVSVRLVQQVRLSAVPAEQLFATTWS